MKIIHIWKKPAVSRLIFIFFILSNGFFFSLGLVISADAQDNKIIRLSLDQCLERAIERDPGLMAGRADLGIAEAQHLEAMSLKYLPKLELTNAFTVAPGINIAGGDLLNLDTRNNWRRLGIFNRLELSFIQPILSFGRISGTIDAARHGITAREEGINRQRNQIALRITQLYFSRLLAKELISLADEAENIVRKAEETLNRMLSEEDNPDLNEADLFRIKLFKLELEKTRREIEKNNELTLSAMKSSLGINAEESFDISDEYLDVRQFEILQLDHYLNLEQRHRPEIAQINAAYAAQNALTQVSRSFYYPLFFIGGGTTLSFAPMRDDIHNPFLKDPFNYKSFGAYLGISMPLNFRQTRARVAKAGYELDKIGAQRTAARNVLHLEVQKAYLDLMEAEKNMQANRKALVISREWKTTEQISFDLDGTNAKDLVDAVQAYMKTNAALFQSIFEYNISVAELEYVTGTIGKK